MGIPLNKLKPLHSHNSLASLQAEWFVRIEYFYQAITELDNLQCLTRCSGRCCPQVMTDKPPGYAVAGQIVILLPFELEYLLSTTNATRDQFGTMQIEILPDTPLDIGIINNQSLCPYLSSNNQCGIYLNRPFDCRSFPLVPIFGIQEKIRFEVEATCPSSSTLSSPFQLQMKKLWTEIQDVLPISYQQLYNDL